MKKIISLFVVFSFVVFWGNTPSHAAWNFFKKKTTPAAEEVKTEPAAAMPESSDFQAESGIAEETKTVVWTPSSPAPGTLSEEEEKLREEEIKQAIEDDKASLERHLMKKDVDLAKESSQYPKKTALKATAKAAGVVREGTGGGGSRPYIARPAVNPNASVARPALNPNASIVRAPQRAEAVSVPRPAQNPNATVARAPQNANTSVARPARNPNRQ